MAITWPSWDDIAEEFDESVLGTGWDKIGDVIDQIQGAPDETFDVPGNDPETLSGLFGNIPMTAGGALINPSNSDMGNMQFRIAAAWQHAQQVAKVQGKAVGDTWESNPDRKPALVNAADWQYKYIKTQSALDSAANKSYFDSLYGSGSSGGTGIDTASLEMQQAAIEDTLARSMEQIASQFELMTAEMERQKEASALEMDAARVAALESLTAMSADLEQTSTRTQAQMAASALRTGGDIGAATEGALRRLGSTSDVISDGARRAIEEEGQSEVGLAASEAQIQSDLSARLGQITEGQLGRSRGSAEQIAQGGQTAMSASMASLLSQQQAQRSGTEFEVGENARQAALELALNPPTRSWGGTAGGPLAGMDHIRQAGLDYGMSETEIMLRIEAGTMFDRLGVGKQTGNNNAQILSQVKTDEELAALAVSDKGVVNQDVLDALALGGGYP